MRQFVRPDPVDQLVCRNQAIRVDQQRHQNAALAGRADVETLPVSPRLDIAEDPELHRHAYSLYQAAE